MNELRHIIIRTIFARHVFLISNGRLPKLPQSPPLSVGFTMMMNRLEEKTNGVKYYPV
jgi:hypothetical protein